MTNRGLEGLGSKYLVLRPSADPQTQAPKVVQGLSREQILDALLRMLPDDLMLRSVVSLTGDIERHFGHVDERTLANPILMLQASLSPNFPQVTLSAERGNVKISRYATMYDRPTRSYVRHPLDSDSPDMSCTPMAEEEEGGRTLGFPLANNFRAAERVLMSCFKEWSKTGPLKDDPIVAVNIGAIQNGFQHVILRADCQTAFGQTYSFVITTSRDPIFNQDLMNDHATTRKLRAKEAARMGKETNDPAFIAACNIPIHYHTRQPQDPMHGPAVYVAPFLMAEELNLTFHKDPYTGAVTRVVERNPMNQQHGNGTQPLSPEDGSKLMTRIAAIRMKYAVLGGEASLAVMRGGDFMLENGANVESGKIWWHTLRNPTFAKVFLMRGGLTYYAEASKLRPDDMHVASYQTLQLLLDSETDIRTGLGNEAEEEHLQKLWPVYALDEVVNALKISLEAGHLSPEDLEKIIADLGQHQVPDVITYKEELNARIAAILPKLQQIVAEIS